MCEIKSYSGRVKVRMLIASVFNGPFFGSMTDIRDVIG